MSLLMLDTNAASALIKGRAPVLATLLEHRPFCISVITEAELRYGLARRPVGKALTAIVEAFLSSVDSRAWSSAAAFRYGALRSQLEAIGKPLGALDLLIAAHALAEGCELVTADHAFAQVPGLALRTPTE